MAILNSVIIGRGKKSVGEATLAYQRGRTIARRRVVENSSNTESQNRQRLAFKTVVRLTTPFKSFFAHAFQRTKYGSAYNSFIKQAAPRWISRKFEACAKGNDAWGASEAWGYDFETAIRVLLNDGLTGLPKNKEQWGSNIPFVGYGELTPLSEIPLGSEILMNTTREVKLRMSGGDLKGWTLSVCGYISKNDYLDSEGEFYFKTYDLYKYGAFPKLELEQEAEGGTLKTTITTDVKTGIIEADIRGASLIADILGDGLSKEEKTYGWMSYTLRKYQKYPKLQYYLKGYAQGKSGDV